MIEPSSGASHMAEDIASQPDLWKQSAVLTDLQALLPSRAARIGVIGEESSPAAAFVDNAVALPVADEQSVVQTRFATAALALLRASLGERQEAALKMREASQSWAESYPSVEYRHGSISTAVPGQITWQCGAAPEGLDEVAATRARFGQGRLDPMAELVRGQRDARARAIGNGLDPGPPRNLTRSVILDA